MPEEAISSGHPPVGLIAGNPLWRPVWGVWGDRRVFRSPASVAIGLVALVLAGRGAVRASLLHLHTQTTPAVWWERWVYHAAIWVHGNGLELLLLILGLAVLWRAVRETPLGSSLVATPLGPPHLVAVALGPIAAVWVLSEGAQWVHAVMVANRVADPGESLLWLVRRPGRITFLADPVATPAVVLSHNILAGSIALMGYGVYLLFWAWVLLRLTARQRDFGRALIALLCVRAAMGGSSWLIAQVQGVVSLVNPMAIWTFPPGTATQSAWRLQLASPLHHFLMYLTMHLAILVLEMGLVGLLTRAVERGMDELWDRAGSRSAS